MVVEGKIQTRPQVARWAKLLRDWHRKVVFTNGCFDILHAGHASLLSWARHLGHVLIVGLNSDDSVRMLKGAGRPIVPERQRALLLCYFDFVDAVTIFDEPTPEILVRAIRPDVLVKGEDWADGEVVGAECAGRVERFQFLEEFRDCSTTRLIEKIRGN